MKSGAYRNRSVSVFPDKQHGWRLRHVGWLGAVPPAIDGLAPVEFAGSDSEALEFAAPGYSLVWGMESIAKLLRGLRERIVEKEGIEAADAALPQWQIDSALEAAASARTQFQEADAGTARLFNQPDNPGGSMSFSQEQLDAARAEAVQAAEDRLKADFAARDAELVQLKAERQRERIGNQIKDWKAEGKLLPAEESGLAEFMGQLEEAGAEFAFSASDGAEARKTPSQYFTDFMAARKSLVRLGVAQADPKSEPAASKDPGVIANRAREFTSEQAAKGITVELHDAIARFTPKA